MRYLSEFRAEWRPLTAAVIGLGSGYSIGQITTNIVAPHLLNEFHWTKSDFALLSTLGLVALIMIPLAGRLTDIFGVRRTATIGTIALPLFCIAFSQMTGDIRQYIVLFLLQTIICVTTTTTVFCRVVVERFKHARGLALAIFASGPAVTGLIGGPILNEFVNANGWRAGYLAAGLFSAVFGTIALLMLPRDHMGAGTAAKRVPRRAKQDYGMILSHPAFWVMFAALLLCNIPQSIVFSQLNLLMIDNAATPTGISVMIGTFWAGTLTGRFATGLALDRFPTHIVATLAMAVPSTGLFLIASSLDAPAVLTFAVFLVGLAFGAEGDLIGYLVARIFGVSIFSSIMGLMAAAMTISTTAGAFLNSYILKVTGSYSLFILISGFSVLFGSLLFLLLGNRMKNEAGTEEPDIELERRVSSAA